MLNLGDIKLFIRISETGGISAAARSLGMTAATASAAIKRMERQLGSQLFERSTRSLRLTQAGESFIAYCLQSIQLLDEGMAALKDGREGLSGEIHLGAPSDLGRDHLDGLLEPFRQRHPQIRLVMHLSDRIEDLYRNPFDLVLRYGLMRDSTLIAKKLCDNDRVICAAPAYLARAGQPANVAALTRHNCICVFRNGELFNKWSIVEAGRTHEIQVSGDRAADDGALVRKWALQGCGIAYKSKIDIQSDLAAGRLIDLFPKVKCEAAPLYAVYPSRGYQPARLTALLQFLEDAFNNGADT